LPYVLRWREIRHNGGRLRALAADADTGDGIIPTLALVDELHRHRSGELYGLLRDGLDARGGRIITISTAGYNSDSPLGILRTQAQQLPSFTREGVYCHATGDGFAYHEWSLTDEDDLTDLKLVKKANPARHHTIATLKRRMNSPSMTPAQWARFACGVWTEGEDSWIEPKDWDSLKVDIGGVAEGESVWVAVDVGTNPAFGIAAQRPEGGVAVDAVMFEGDTPLEVVENKLVELSERYSIQVVSYDGIFRRSAELLTDRNLPMEELPHSPERIAQASTVLKRLIGEKKLRHGGNDALRAQVMAGVTKETERGWRLVKSPHSRALIALAIACHEATRNAPQPGLEFISLGS
jgi:phage terminase large subunit-like protein